MATFRGTDWFSSGPTRVVPVTTETVIKTTRFPGLDGEYHLSMGRTGGRILQEGTLIGASGALLKTAVNNLRSQVGTRGTLVDDLGSSYYNCTMVRVTFDQPRETDPQGNHYAHYTVEYRQALSSIV